MQQQDHLLRRRQRRSTGQSLAEYALTLALIAVIVIAVAGLVGLAVERVFGVVAGALGTKHDTQGIHTIVIENAVCEAVIATHQTGLLIYGTTNEAVANLTGSTESAVGTGLNHNPAPVTTNLGVPGTFLWNPLLSATKADLSLCPQSVVIQASDGALALSPVTTVSG